MEGHKRVVIEHVHPQIDCGKHHIKRIFNEPVKVTADIFGDGHDKVDAVLLYREARKGPGREKKWQEVHMKFTENDHWKGSFTAASEGIYEYTILAWVDHFSTWKHKLQKKIEARQELRTELLVGAEMMEEAMDRTTAAQKKKLKSWSKLLRDESRENDAISEVFDDDLAILMYETRNREISTQYHKVLKVRFERKRSLFSAWYEFFPRSTAPDGSHGNFNTSEKILPEIAKMGFNVVYLPPIHPIGHSFRKGRNNSTEAQPGDPGSPWAIGSEEGGHKAIHPDLGTIEDFRSFVETANSEGLEVALDFAIQCSPDHPYVKNHPQWFLWRPDGTVQYAENPPKKYQDVLPVNFETEDWEALWKELKTIVEYWIENGVKIFRVDNPHTKPFIFWEWLIAEINAKYEGVIFLAEAFTRPRVMEKLAKVGFTQSYTYFTWRNSKEEFQQYLTELTKTDLRQYFRPNFWPNTPDILPISLENQPESAFLIRVILAGTLSSNFGMYGPIYEYGENEAFPGKEEYNHNEKYEIKKWDWSRPTKIKDGITKLNQVRERNPALHSTWNINFAETDNPQLMCYTKTDEDTGNRLIIVVNLDPHHSQSGWVKVPLHLLDLHEHTPYTIHDELNDASYTWQNEWNYVELHPQHMPAHIFRIE